MFLATISKDHFRISSKSTQYSGYTIILLLSGLCLALAMVSASEIQPANQAQSLSAPAQPSAEYQSQQQQTTSRSSPVGSSSSTGPAVGGSSGSSNSGPQRLPNINIYINKNEIKKLLGIDSRINYVTNGNINSYPFAFTIPLGYNQSDIIFTWQNLGQTNVNYSISLVIGNIQAVDPPLINITRSGLIPKHEQVFKITLPCSGKVTDEVDVQVLINIAGYVSDDELPASTTSEGSAPMAAQDASVVAAAAAAVASAAKSATTQASGELQADQAEPKQFRLVSHTLAIKRKKICTMHPLQVPVQPRPPTQQQQQQQSPQLVAHQQASWPQTVLQLQLQRVNQQSQRQDTNVNRWPQHQHQQFNQQQAAATDNQQAPIASNKTGTTSQNGLEGAHNWPDFQEASPASTPTLESGAAISATTSASALDSLEANTRKLEILNLIPAPASRHHHHQQQQQFGVGISGGRRLQAEAALPSLGFYPAAWPGLAGVRGGASSGGLNSPPSISPENPLNDIILMGRQSQLPSLQQQQSVNSSSIRNNPLLLTLIGCSLLISIALVVVVVLGSSHKTLLDKIGALTGWLLRRTPTSQANKCKSPMAGAVIGSLRTGPKSSASSVSGLSAVSGQSLSKLPAYCYKGTASVCTGYYTNNYQQQQHHYQHPPTADLLGTGYQCQQQQPSPHYPVYHIATGNNNQTTRLIWNNGNGTSPDGFTIDGGSYMPLSNAPRSDSGSAYQTIY